MAAEESDYGSYADDGEEEDDEPEVDLQDSHRHALEALHHSVNGETCNGCGYTIQGVRYTCPRTACNFDFCKACYKKAVRKGNQQDVLAVNPWLAAEAVPELVITVDSYEAVKDQPTVFAIKVVQQLPSGPNEYFLKFRYSELLKLHQQVNKEKTFEDPLPPFPKKKRVGKKKEKFLEQRMEQLAHYFEELMATAQVKFQPCFREAFQLDASSKIQFADDEKQEEESKIAKVKEKLKKVKEKRKQKKPEE